MACGPPSAASGPLPFFQFRPRLESVDWRRLSAIDVDKVAGAVDVLTLQENIMNITFCKLEDEKYPSCQSWVDKVLLKLIRLEQLTHLSAVRPGGAAVLEPGWGRAEQEAPPQASGQDQAAQGRV